MPKETEYNDYELLYLYNEGNEEAGRILYNKYKLVAELKAKNMVDMLINLDLILMIWYKKV